MKSWWAAGMAVVLWGCGAGDATSAPGSTPADAQSSSGDADVQALRDTGFVDASGQDASAFDASSSGDSGPDSEAPDSTDTGVPSDPNAFACEADQQPVGVPLRRMTRVQYRNTLSAFVRSFDGDAEFIEWLADGEIPWQLQALPDDRRMGPDRHGGFRRVDQAVTQRHVEVAYFVAETLAQQLGADWMLANLAATCAPGSSCVDQLIERVGERAHRRPLSAEELDFYRSIHGAGSEPVGAGWRRVLTIMMAGPHMLYHVEHGQPDAAQDVGVAALDAFELANRLSYHFWQSPPDDELMAAAGDQSLLTDAVYAAQVDRLASDSRAREAMRSFYREWFWLDELPEMDIRSGTAVFEAFLDGFQVDGDLREAMIDELTDMALWYTVDAPDALDALLTSTASFARSESVAALYGLPAWNGVSEPPQHSDPAREGILTRAGRLASGSANTRPIMKGLFVRLALLCDTVPPPPDNAAATPPALDPGLTTREVVEQLTEQPDTQCIGCHKTLINPFGFVTESFDALGRAREAQVLIDASGEVLGTKPVDTTTQLIFGSVNAPAQDVRDLNHHLLESGRVHACLARQLFRFTWGRTEVLGDDGCALEPVRQAAVSGNLGDVWRAVAMTPAFRRRSFVEEVTP